MKCVVVESPYAGNVTRNSRYALLCAQDCIARGEAPFLSHLFYTLPGFLNDNDPAQCILGMECGLAWLRHADLQAIYTDLGMSAGMQMGLAVAIKHGIPREYRTLADGAIKAVFDGMTFR